MVVRAADAADYDRVLDALSRRRDPQCRADSDEGHTIDRLPKLLAQFGDAADIGIGTRNGQQLTAAVDTGAHYLVTPITDPDLVDAANRARIRSCPVG